MKYNLVVYLFCIIWMSNPTHIDAEEKQELKFEDIEDFSLNELLDLAVSVSSSGKEELSAELVPEPIFVLSSEEIKRSGATNIPEALRLVPGIDVLQLNPAHYEVSVHGHEGYMANDYLVLIDGRPAYANIFKATMWMNLPVVIEEIDHIEVVFGPNSTIYGSNALGGLINIITKKPHDDYATARLEVGPQGNKQEHYTYDNVYASGVLGKNWGKLSTRTAFSFQRMNSWDEDGYAHKTDSYKPMQAVIASAAAHYAISEKSEAKLNLGFNWQDGDLTPFYREHFQISSYFADVELNTSGVFFDNDDAYGRVYWRGTDASAKMLFDPLIPVADFTFFENTAGLMGHYRMSCTEWFSLSLGVDAELQGVDSDLLVSEFTSVIYAGGWIQGKFSLADKLTLQIGGRLQGQIIDQESNVIFVPKGSLVYQAAKQHVFRLSVGQGFMYPMLLESFGNIAVLNGNLLLLSGNPDLKEVKLIGVNAGYQYHIPKLLTLKLDVFYSQQFNLMGIFSNTGIVDTNAIYTFSHRDRNEQFIGGEFRVDVSPADWIRIKIAYAVHFSDWPYIYNAPFIPLHKVYLSFGIDPIKQLSLDLNGFFMSANHDWGTVTPTYVVNGIEVVNVRIAYHINKQFDVVLNAYNILPIDWGQSLFTPAVDAESTMPSSEHIGTRVMIGLYGNF